VRHQAIAVIALASAVTVAATGATTALAGTWVSPAASLSPTGASSFNPSVAVTPSGEAVALWMQQALGGVNVVRASRLQGTVWSSPITLSSGGDALSYEAIAIDSSGVATAVWSRYANSGPPAVIVEAARSTGAGWSAPVVLDTGQVQGGTDFARPAVAVDPAGNVTATWQNYDGTSWTVKVARFSSGQWGATTALSPPAISMADPAVAAPATGAATVVWGRTLGGQRPLEASSFESGRWQDAVTVGSDASLPKVAGSADGTVVATWLDTSGANNVVRVARRTGGAWSAPQTVSPDGQDAFGPTVAVDATGMATVGWGTQGGQQSMWVTRSVGSGWGAAQDIQGGTGSVQVPAASANGPAVVAWTRAVGIDNAIWASGFTGSAWSTPVQLATSASEAAIAVDAAGAAVAAWQRDAGGNQIIQAMRFITSPSAPRGPAATAGQERATVSWTAPISDGGAAITSYTATATPGGRTCTASAASGCTVEGLTGGTAYTFSVTATNSQGTSPASAASAAVTPTAAPSPAPQVRKLGAKYRLAKRTLTTTGKVPAGATSVIQSATTARTKTIGAAEHAARARTARGTCRIRTTGKGKSRTRTFTCTLTFTAKGRWAVTTTARKRTEAVARATRVVTLRK